MLPVVEIVFHYEEVLEVSHLKTLLIHPSLVPSIGHTVILNGMRYVVQSVNWEYLENSCNITVLVSDLTNEENWEWDR